MWTYSLETEIALDETLKFSPTDQQHWDEEQASVHAKTTYVKIIHWARGEIARTGKDPDAYLWLGGGLRG